MGKILFPLIRACYLFSVDGHFPLLADQHRCPFAFCVNLHLAEMLHPLTDAVHRCLRFQILMKNLFPFKNLKLIYEISFFKHRTDPALERFFSVSWVTQNRGQKLYAKYLFQVCSQFFHLELPFHFFLVLL